jgi:hypothetical protein
MNCEHRIVLRGSDNGFLSTGLLTNSSCEQIANNSNRAVIAGPSRDAPKNYSQPEWSRTSFGEQVVSQTFSKFCASGASFPAGGCVADAAVGEND